MEKTVKEIMTELRASWDNKPVKIRKAYFDRQKGCWIHVRDVPQPQWLKDLLSEGRYQKRRFNFIWAVMRKFPFSHLDNVRNCLRRKSRMKT